MIHPLSPRRYSLAVGLVLLALLALVALSVAEGRETKSAQAERMRLLAGERGCTVCHREAPTQRDADEALPLAPSWREIAARYRGHAGAEERLARAVSGGADPSGSHWKGRLEFNRMDANPTLTRQEARLLVRWILSSPSPR